MVSLFWISRICGADCIATILVSSRSCSFFRAVTELSAVVCRLSVFRKPRLVSLFGELLELCGSGGIEGFVSGDYIKGQLLEVCKID